MAAYLLFLIGKATQVEPKAHGVSLYAYALISGTRFGADCGEQLIPGAGLTCGSFKSSIRPCALSGEVRSVKP